MLHYVHHLVGMFGVEQAVYSRSEELLHFAGTTLMRAVRMNQNSKVVGCKTKTMSLKTANLL